MNALYFWEPRPGLSLDDHCNPYGPLLAQALAKRSIHLEWTSYDITIEELAARCRLERKRRAPRIPKLQNQEKIFQPFNKSQPNEN